MYDDRDRPDRAHDTRGGDAPGHAPGKRTLTSQLAPRVAARAGAELGHDFSGVTVREDGQADALGTRAFARGDALHFAAGAYQPDSPSGVSLIGHELAHVAQQREGRVAPTGRMGGLAVNTDPSLEAEADAGGAKVAQGFDLHGFLDFAPPGGAASVASPVVQGEDLAPSGEGTATASTAPAPGAPRTHVVQGGEEIATIAKQYGVTPQALKNANQTKLHTFTAEDGTKVLGFYADEVITIPAAAAAPAAPAPAADPAAEPPGECEPEAPPPPEPGMVETMIDAVAGFFGAAWDTLVGEDGEEVEPIDVVLDESPVEPVEPGESQQDLEVDTTQLTQTKWYGADGLPLKPEDETLCKTVLEAHSLWHETNTSIVGARSDAYSNYLRDAARPATVTYWSSGNEKTEDVPADVVTLPQIKFIPGQASCLRAAKAMASETGAEIEGNSGAKLSHIQVILGSDQDVTLDAEGNPIKAGTKDNLKTSEKGDKTDFHKAEMKDTAEIDPERLKIIQANVSLACSYLDAELAAGRAVVIGVSYTTRDGNADQTTDHWMCVYAKIGSSYQYFDPGKSGTDGQGVLAVNPAKGGVLEGTNSNRVYTLAQVQLNTASSGAPSSVDVAKTWEELAGDANSDLNAGSAESKGEGRSRNDQLSW